MAYTYKLAVIFMKTLIITSFIFLTLIIIYHYRLWKSIKNYFYSTLKNEKEKKLFLINYPKELKTDYDIKLFIKKNRKQFPKNKQWDLLSFDFIKEISKVGWNSEMPIYTYENFDNYNIKIIANDREIQEKIDLIIIKFIQNSE